jgi:hypothetical protein
VKHRGKQVLKWSLGDLILTVRSTGTTIETTITRGSKVLHHRDDFATWNGAISAINVEANNLDR